MERGCPAACALRMSAAHTHAIAVLLWAQAGSMQQARKEAHRFQALVDVAFQHSQLLD